jgi:alkylation response protein AidB-like acyl-CoA dehydrogenase
MTFELSAHQVEWQARGGRLGRQLAPTVDVATVVAEAGRAGLLDSSADLLADIVAIEALGVEHAPAAMGLAFHIACSRTLAHEPDLRSGRRVGALTLATDQFPIEQNGRLDGRASWVAPLTSTGLALIGASRGAELVACAVDLTAEGVSVDIVPTAGLDGVSVGHIEMRAAPCSVVGPTLPVMTLARVCVSAVGLGIARRAVREALTSARGTTRGAGGEQTAQGLIADAATDLDAAMLLTWQAAASGSAGSLAAASMAKLAATLAAQRAVERATQVIGADSFRDGHVVSRLSRDVRALELFAGRTEALRDAVALDHL